MKLVIFDWKWTLYHPANQALVPGARELIDYLRSQNTKMVIIGKDQGGDMASAVKRLGVREYFSDIRFIDDVKTPELFSEYAKDFHPDQVWVVGDRIKGEIDAGNKIGAKTVWLKFGKFSNELPESDEEQPDYTFTSLHDLLKLFLDKRYN